MGQLDHAHWLTANYDYIHFSVHCNEYITKVLLTPTFTTPAHTLITTFNHSLTFLVKGVPPVPVKHSYSRVPSRRHQYSNTD